jgi:hypothetical protein
MISEIPMNIKEILTYNEENGMFAWRISPSYNVKNGDVAGCIRRNLMIDYNEKYNQEWDRETFEPNPILVKFLKVWIAGIFAVCLGLLVYAVIRVV